MKSIVRSDRLEMLEKFCLRVGILVKSAPSASRTSADADHHLSFGTYGHLLLMQIRNEWLRTNLFKFRNVHLVEGLDFPTSRTTTAATAALLPASSSAAATFGIANVSPQAAAQKASARFLDRPLLLQHSRPFTLLNGYYFYTNSKPAYNPIGHFERTSGSFAFWLRERQNWWSRVLNSPENIFVEQQQNNDSRVATNQCQLMCKHSSAAEALELEQITTLTERSQIEAMFAPGDHGRQLGEQVRQLTVTRTSAERVLENILHDSVHVTESKDASSFVFNLDYRLAPYKTCILLEASDGDDDENDVNMRDIGNDMLKRLVAHSNSTYTERVASVSRSGDELQRTYAHMDELGVPYSIYLPATVTKDGLCSIRSRDTGIQEQTHISLVHEHFANISGVLSLS